MESIQELLKRAKDLNASDLHLTSNAPPLYRVNGRLRPSTNEKLNPDHVLSLSYSIMTEEQRKLFEREKEVDFSFGIANLGRYRANVFIQRGTAACALRLIPTVIKPLAELGLPAVVSELCNKPNGLVLVTGPTGSGKSTTLASMVDMINSTKEGHILTVEDPIEFVHQHKSCIVNQREVLHDTQSFAKALRVALRQDPDVVLIGEMRDLETIQAALSIAETGHLTLATLHTNSASKSINRIIDVFPPEQKTTIRTQLSMVLAGIISQTLIPKVNGGMAMACEVMIATPAIRALIREDKIHQLDGIMEIGQQYGMQTMNSSLMDLCRKRVISKKDALNRSPDPESIIKNLGPI